MITIYVGDNGSGKSQMLASLTKEALRENKNVIAIATAINDKFPKRDKNKPYHYMGARLGRYVAREAIKEAFRTVRGKDDEGGKLISSVFQILKYANFEEAIGFDIRGFNEHFDDISFDNQLEDGYEFHELSSVLYRIRHYLNDNGGGILWVNNYTLFGEGLSGEVLLLLLKYEPLLKKLKLIKSLEIFVKKNNNIFPFIHASSGELSLIATTIFIASKIDDNTTIFIDEPENSLHPDWQRQYVPNLVNIFPYYKLDVCIASHSPLLISGCANEEAVAVLRHDGHQFSQVRADIKNVEEAYIDQFGVITPENNALSERCIDIINNVEWRNITNKSACDTVLELIEQSFDIKQQEFLDGVLGILKALEVQNG